MRQTNQIDIVNKSKIQMILAMTIFGTIGVVRRYIPCSSSLLALVRGIIGTLFLLCIHFINKDKFNMDALKNNALVLCVSGALIGFNWILLFEAYNFTTVSVATMCYYMAPVFVILASPIVLHEKLTTKKGICAFFALLGMVMVSGVLETGLTGIKGVLLGLGAAVLYATVVILNRFIKGLPAGDRTIVQLGAASVTLLPYIIFTKNIDFPQVSPFIVVMLLILGIIHTGFAYTLYFGSMTHIPAQTVALFSYIDPIVAVVLSVTFLKEKMSAVTLLGVVIVIVSLVFSEMELKKVKYKSKICK